jgi:transketolase
MARTHIGYGLPTRQDTEKAHGEPPGDDELNGAKRKLSWPEYPRFFIPDDVLDFFRNVGEKGEEKEEKWKIRMEEYKNIYPKLYNELQRRLDGELPKNWMVDLPVFEHSEKGIATRVASGLVLNKLATKIPELIGGSADLAPSNKTWINDSPSFQKETYQGRNFHFGVREHAMGACINGMAVYKGIIPYGGTFLVFSDYLRPAIRLSALSHYASIWLFTHDSIGLGEDGPTHQPIEQLAALRAIPNLIVLRPADANEVTEAWKFAVSSREGPTALILSRQSIPTIDRQKFSPASGLLKGAYVLADLGDGEPEIILMATGSEVNLIIDAGQQLEREGRNVRLVSFPSWELFKAQSDEYQNSVLLSDVRNRISVEAGVGQGWERWVGDNGEIISVEQYGASAPYKKIYSEFGITIENILITANRII